MQKYSSVSSPDTSGSVALIDSVASWLMAGALGATSLEDLLSGCCEQLYAAGIPICRAHITFPTLHPLYASISLTWLRGTGIERTEHSHVEADEDYPDRFLQSPIYYMLKHRLPFLRRPLTGAEALLDFPFLEELRSNGVTDYFAYLIEFGGGEMDGMIGSWAVDNDNGLSNAHIKSLQRIQYRLGVACKMRLRDQIAENVVSTYMGPNAGLRVLNGQIRRGDGETIHAAFWYSDLRGSTELAETLASDAFIALLNTYFEAAAGAVLANGGEVLSFIGDAVLAVFPFESDGTGAEDACRQAYKAQHQAHDRLRQVNADRKTRGKTPLRFGTALHLGQAVFGNIGVAERLSFTVIGTTVNEVSRLEDLTKSLGEDVLATEKFAKMLNVPWRSLGAHVLRGTPSPTELFAPPVRDI